MNTNDNLEDNFTSFSLSPESRAYLVTSAKWAKIIGIFGLVSVVLGVLGMVAFIYLSGFFYGSTGANNGIEFLMGIYFVLLLVILIISTMPFYFLYKFATQTNASLIEFKGVPLHRGITYLKSFFKTIVLLTLVLVAFYLIFIVMMINYAAF